MKYIVTLSTAPNEKAVELINKANADNVGDLTYELPDEGELIGLSELLWIYDIKHKATVNDEALGALQQVVSPWEAHDRIQNLLDDMDTTQRMVTIEYLLTTNILDWKPEYRRELLTDAVDRVLETAAELEEGADFVTQGTA
jgi:hypothetical protein